MRETVNEVIQALKTMNIDELGYIQMSLLTMMLTKTQKKMGEDLNAKNKA